MKKRGIIDYVWFWLLALGLLYGLCTGKAEPLSEAAMAYAGKAVTLSISLIGTMGLWLGLLEIAKESGLTEGLARLLAPLLSRLFPGVPKGHPALGAISMNMAANLLGLGNAATPFGLQAMKELSSLSEKKEMASHDMVLFLCLNTASITLVPGNVIALRASLGSQDPGAVLLPTILASLLSSLFAVILCKVYARIRKSR